MMIDFDENFLAAAVVDDIFRLSTKIEKYWSSNLKFEKKIVVCYTYNCYYFYEKKILTKILIFVRARGDLSYYWKKILR